MAGQDQSAAHGVHDSAAHGAHDSAADAHDSATHDVRLLRALVCLMFFTFAMTTDAVGSVIPKIIEEFALSLTAAGAFQYASMAGIGAGALLLGFLADRIGHKRATIERILEHLGPRSNAKIHRARTTTDRGGSALMPGSTDTPLPGSPAPRQLTEGPLYALSANNTGFRDLSANSAGSPGMTVIRG